MIRPEMSQFLLIRHAVNDWVNTGKLAGWTPEVHLNDLGKAQAQALGERLASMKIHALYASPLERTMETAEAIAAHHPHLTIQPLAAVGEVHYGAWQGEELRRLYGKKMWRNVQVFPTRAQFPEGETLRGAQARAVDAIEELVPKHPRQTVVIVSHSDIIKMIVAHYLGVHLDLFQRVNISPASITTLNLDAGMPFIQAVNDTSHNPKEEPKDESAEGKE
jgi:probable phosphoglycerate mutase